jgi:hypothetical protein
VVHGEQKLWNHCSLRKFKAKVTLVIYSTLNIPFLYRIVLTVSWIPRKDNEVADFYSRILDVDDWGVSDAFFTFSIHSGVRSQWIDLKIIAIERRCVSSLNSGIQTVRQWILFRQIGPVKIIGWCRPWIKPVKDFYFL